MKITATIQARMGSSRLPRKTLKPIMSKPMLWYQIERIKQSRLIDQIIIATSTAPADDEIEEFGKKYGITVFRGSEDDVYGRVVECLKAHQVDIHTEFMGDNPIPDAVLIDSILGFYLKNKDKYDYVSNALSTTYPAGFEVYVYPANVLIEAEKYITEPKLREHVNLHIYQKTEHFRICNLEAPEIIQKYKDYHFEVDTAEDFEVISAVIEYFFPKNPHFSMVEAIQFLESRPDLIAKNSEIHRRWQVFRKD